MTISGIENRESLGSFEELRDVKEFARESLGSTLSDGLFGTFSKVGKIAHSFFSLMPGINFALPINRFSGYRSFYPPAILDRILGSFIYFFQKKDSSYFYTPLLKDTLDQLQMHNSHLLQQGQGGNNNFHYEIEANYSSQVNAFCLPGGKMIVYTGLVDQIWANRIKEVRVDFADGSWANVSVESVRKEDILAALIGHEITHAAARHFIVKMVAKVVCAVCLRFAALAYTAISKANDLEYQSLLHKERIGVSTEVERKRLVEKEMSYALTGLLIDFVESKIEYFFNLFHSRECEYEADVSGIYMANRAGYNPLGGLVLQEILSKGEWIGLRKFFDFFFTHPCGTYRKRVAFAAAAKLCPESLVDKVEFHKAHSEEKFDSERSHPSLFMADRVEQLIYAR